jgi:hypothetical protein
MFKSVLVISSEFPITLLFLKSTRGHWDSTTLDNYHDAKVIYLRTSSVPFLCCGWGMYESFEIEMHFRMSFLAKDQDFKYRR